MKKKTVYVGIINLKGGTGKSVVTTVAASLLHFTMDKNVGIVDGDKPQYSIFSMRERDLKMVSDNSYYKELFQKQFGRLQKKAYAVRKSDPKDILTVADKLTEQNHHLDVIFFDLSGNVSAEGILETVLNMDYIFCPIIADRIVLQSSISFITTVTEWLDSHPDSYPLKDVYVFWNRIDSRENKGVYNIANSMIKKLGIKIMRTEIPDTSRFKKEMSAAREVFRSTLFPPNKPLLRGTRMDLFVDELCRIIKI